MWYREVIGGNRCPIVDTWWQTETGAIMISPLPGVTSTKPGSAMSAIPGISTQVVDDNGVAVPNGHGG
jgi:acetyl-CoA synthetase